LSPVWNMIAEAISQADVMKEKSYTSPELRQIISEYKSKRLKHPDSHIEYVKSLSPNFTNVIVAATVALDGKGEKHIHQYRMSNARLRQFAKKLCEYEKELKGANSFEDILKIISGIRVFGLGAALYYDTSLRIAYTKENCLPDQIYLVRGTLKGAKNLGIDTRGKTSISREELPAELKSSDLNCAELADLMACYFSEGRWCDCLEFVS
jgi:hypothetical protein